MSSSTETLKSNCWELNAVTLKHASPTVEKVSGAASRAIASLLVGLASLIASSLAHAQDLAQILQAVEKAHSAVESLDVRVEIIDTNPSSPKENDGAVTREERFAFKGENRRFEKWNHNDGENVAKHEISLLGTRRFQQMTDGDFLVFGGRDKCEDMASFSSTTYGVLTGWEFPDPSIRNENMRQALSYRSLITVLQNTTYRIIKRDGDLITLQGISDPRPVAKVFDSKLPADIPCHTDTIVLDASRSFVIHSRRFETPKIADDFFQIRNFDFEQVSPSVWLPKQGECELKEGERHHSEKWKAVSLKVNAVDDHVFEKDLQEDLKPRAWFVDLDGKPDPKTGGLPAQRVEDAAPPGVK